MAGVEDKIKQEHKDFLRQIANEVYGLVRKPENMAHFRRQVKTFCEKNEEYQREIELLEKASSADSKLQKVIKERTGSIIPDCISFYPRKPEGFENYVFHQRLKDYDGMYKHYDGFWGHPAKTANLCEFLTPPPERYGPNSVYWQFEFSKQPDDDEKLICCYALLVSIHDIQVSEKPIFPAKTYKGAWGLCNKWKRIVWGDLKCDGWDVPSDDLIEALSDTRAWIQRALGDVKADLAATFDVDSSIQNDQNQGTKQPAGTERENGFCKICSQDEVDRFKSFHDRFTRLLKEHDLSCKQREQLFGDIEDFGDVIVPIGKKVGVDLSAHVDTVGEIWEQLGSLSEPSDNSFAGDEYGEAASAAQYEYEEKVKAWKEAIADLDKVMVALYRVRPAINRQPDFMSITQLRKQFDVNENSEGALRKRLERFRKKHALNTDAFIESNDRGMNKPKYYYNAKMVSPIIEELKSKKTSDKRPSEKT